MPIDETGESFDSNGAWDEFLWRNLARKRSMSVISFAK